MKQKQSSRKWYWKIIIPMSLVGLIIGGSAIMITSCKDNDGGEGEGGDPKIDYTKSPYSNTIDDVKMLEDVSKHLDSYQFYLLYKNYSNEIKAGDFPYMLPISNIVKWNFNDMTQTFDFDFIITDDDGSSHCVGECHFWKNKDGYQITANGTDNDQHMIK